MIKTYKIRSNNMNYFVTASSRQAAINKIKSQTGSSKVRTTETFKKETDQVERQLKKFGIKMLKYTGLIAIAWYLLHNLFAAFGV